MCEAGDILSSVRNNFDDVIKDLGIFHLLTESLCYKPVMKRMWLFRWGIPNKILLYYGSQVNPASAIAILTILSLSLFFLSHPGSWKYNTTGSSLPLRVASSTTVNKQSEQVDD